MLLGADVFVGATVEVALGIGDDVALGEIPVFVAVLVRDGNNVRVAVTVHVGRLVRVLVGVEVDVGEGVCETTRVTEGTGVSSWARASLTLSETSSPAEDISRKISSMMFKETRGLTDPESVS